MAAIACYFSVMSPYSYLAMGRLAGIAGLRYVPLNFGALAARMGSALLSEASDARRIWAAQDLARQAARHGLAILERPAFWPGNAAPASYAIISAQHARGGDLNGLVAGFCRAVWAEDRNIADDAVIREIMAAHGFDPAIADRGMFAAAEEYAANLEEAAANGVFGVPFVIAGDQRFWGQDRLEDLIAYLRG